MATVTRIDRSNIRTMRSEVETALAAVGAKYGLNFDVGRITFAPDNFRCKITGAVKSAIPNGVAVVPGRTSDAVHLAGYGRSLLGLQVADLSKSYQYSGIGHQGPVKIVGYAPRRFKYPFSIQTARGARYKISLAMARELVKHPIA
jgi:hypothetical protein